jgi:uncharacterized protein (TIRG00374 family)
MIQINKIRSCFTVRNVLLFERGIGIAGLAIACWMVYRLGPSRIAAHLHLISWGFFILAGLKALEFFLEAFAWKLIADETDHKISFGKAFLYTLEGNSLNITLTHMGGEGLKALAFRESIGLPKSAAAAIVLKFCAILGFWLVMSGGFILALFSKDLSGKVKVYFGLGIALVTAIILSVSWMQKVGIFRPLAWFLEKLKTPVEWLNEHVLKLTQLDEHILKTYRSRPWRVSAAVLLCSFVWVEEIFSIWLGLRFLGLAESGFTVIIAGTFSFLLTRFLFFVPWRAGIQEGTLVLAFTLLGLSEPVGLSIAILKRLRELLWVFLGLSAFAVETLKSPDINNV